MNADCSLGYVRGIAHTHGSLHLIGKRPLNHRAITFRSLDERVLEELALHLDVLGYEYKRYVQAPGDEKKTQHIFEFTNRMKFARFARKLGSGDWTGRSARRSS